MLRIILIALTSMLMSVSANAQHLLGGLLCNTCVIPPAGVITQTQINAATTFANNTFPSSFIRNIDDTVYVRRDSLPAAQVDGNNVGAAHDQPHSYPE